MSDNTTNSDRTDESSNRKLWDTSRRNFLKAAGAGAGAITLGTATTMSGAASSEPQIPTPRLHVDGNLVKDPEGNTVTLRGLNMIDPKRADTLAPSRGKNAAQMVDLLTDKDDGWHTHVIRIPVQPIDIGEHEPGHIAGPAQPVAFTEDELEDYLETHLDPVVEQCEERGVYAIVDFHRHWRDEENDNVVDWDDEDLDEEVRMFWNTVAPRYADDTHVLYEVYNEPTIPGVWGAATSEEEEWAADDWRDWQEHAQPWVDTIRDHAPETIVLIGSPSWSQVPEGALVEPFEGENLAYTYHIYPEHEVSQNQEWDDTTHEEAIDGEYSNQGVSEVYEEYPLFVTEFGWEDGASSPTSGTTSGFGEPFMDWMESSDAIHWTAWCADIWWESSMFERSFEGLDGDVTHPYEDDIPEECPDLPCEWDLLGEDVGSYDNHMGAFIKDTLEELQDEGVPAGDVSDPGEPGSGDDSLVSVDLSTDQIEAGETAEVTVGLSEIPEGLSGLLGDAGVDDPSVATVVDATVNEEFGMVQDIELADDGSMVNLVAADINRVFEEGATDIELFTLTLEGQSDGEVDLVIEELFETAEGNFYEFELDAPSLTVGDGEDDDDENGEDDEDVTVTADLSPTEIDEGDTAEVAVSISEIPEGLSGLLGDAGVSNPDAATVTDATVNDEFGMIQDIELAEDGSMVNLVAADINRVFEEGETDIELFTLELTGQGAGDTDIVIEELFETADGNFYEFEFDSPTLSVGDVDEPPVGGDVEVTADLSPTEIDEGDTAEVAVSISEIPEGLSGLLGDAGVSNVDAAEVTDATVNDEFGMIQDIEISDDGSMVNLVAADINRVFEEGETDIELFTLELTGQGQGETDIVIEEMFETAEGNFYSFDFDSPTLSVDGDGDGDGPTGDVEITADLSPTEIDEGDTAEVDISISHIPEGLSGLLGDAGVSNVDAATVVDATVNQEFGMIQDIELADDGSMVNLVAADINRVFEEGATDIELFTMTLEGQGEGETEIVLEDMFETAEGNFYDFDFNSPTLSVDGDGDGDGPTGEVEITADLSPTDIDEGDTAEVDISISHIPEGLSGLLGDAGVSNPDAATVTDATVNQEFGMIQDIELADDGSMVNLVAADINRVFEEGATDIELFTLELTGQGDGDTEIVLEDMFETAEGNFYEFDFDSPTLSVDGDGDGPGTEPDPDALVVDDFTSSGQNNDLGRWRGGGDFQNGGEISNGELVLEYDNSGWYASQVDEDVSEYDELVFSVRGDSGGEENDFTVMLGGGNSLAADVADGGISTSTGDLRIDLDALGADQSSPGQLNLNFWQGGNSTIYIDEIRFE